MSREINFLSERHKQIIKQEVADQRLLLFAAIGLAISFGIVVLFSSAQFYLSYRLTQTKNQEAAFRSQIVGDQSTEKTFVVFVHKLNSLAQIDQERQDKKTVIQFFNSFFGANVSIIGVEFDQNQKLLTLQLQTQSVFDLKSVLPQLNTPAITSKFSTVSPSNLTRTQDGKYQLDITVSTVASSSAGT